MTTMKPRLYLSYVLEPLLQACEKAVLPKVKTTIIPSLPDNFHATPQTQHGLQAFIETTQDDALRAWATSITAVVNSERSHIIPFIVFYLQQLELLAYSTESAEIKALKNEDFRKRIEFFLDDTDNLDQLNVHRSRNAKNK
jgi:hypothetical protein